MAADRSVGLRTDAETVVVRRSPKYGAFLAVGALIGVVIAAILTFAFPTEQPTRTGQAVYSTGQVFAFLALICGAGGLALGGVVALIVDRSLARRTRTLSATREVRGDPE